jgi:carbonic anhydrase
MRAGDRVIHFLKAFLPIAGFAAAIALCGGGPFARAQEAAADLSSPAQRSSPLKSSAKDEVLRPIVAGNGQSGGSDSLVSDKLASDSEIELIKKAAADPTAKPVPVRARSAQTEDNQVVLSEGGPGPTQARRSTASADEAKAQSGPNAAADSSPDAAPTAKPGAAHEPKPEASAEPKAEAPPGIKIEMKAVSLAPSDAVAPATALKWLKNGNERFVKRRFRADGRSASDRARLFKGQRPHTIIVSCSDSRVPPEIVFDQMLGEIFVVRLAGEALDSAGIASIEYAVEHLGTRLIVVLGHSRCGAIEAALGAKEGESAGSPDLDKLIEEIRPRLKAMHSDKPSANLEVESALNADEAARELAKRSDILRKRVEEGRLSIKSALYKLDTGKVTFY